VAIANALQLEAAWRHVSCSGLFLDKLVLHKRTNCYFRTSDQNSGAAIWFSESDFLKESSNLAIRERFHAMILTLSLDLERL